MDKKRRDEIEASLPQDRRFVMPPEMTDEARNAAYRKYCERQVQKGYVAWEDVCACFVAAFDAMRR